MHAPINFIDPSSADIELQEVHFKAEQIKDASLESTRRMVSLCEESEKIGEKTLTLLETQSEQLKLIEEGMDHINVDMKEAGKNLSAMVKCCGLCALPCSKSVSSFKEVDDRTWKGVDDGKIINNQPQRVVDNQNDLSNQCGYFGKITNDPRQDEIEENIFQVGSMITNLRNMAIDMGSELEMQNIKVDRINRKGKSNEIRISHENQRAHELIKK